jgi:hypothetical protein
MKKTIFSLCVLACLTACQTFAQAAAGAAGGAAASGAAAGAGAGVNGATGGATANGAGAGVQGGVNANGNGAGANTGAGVNPTVPPTREGLPGANAQGQVSPGLQGNTTLKGGGTNGLSADVNANNANANDGNNLTTNGVDSGTNRVVWNTNSNRLTPASRPGATNRFFETNRFNRATATNGISGTNGSGIGPNDMASTEFDRTLTIRIRQTIVTRLGGTPSAWSSVAINADNGAVTLVGAVPSVMLKQRIVTTVQSSPGVVRVIDQLTVDPNVSFDTSPIANQVVPGGPQGAASARANGNLSPTGQPLVVPRRFEQNLTTTNSSSTTTP